MTKYGTIFHKLLLKILVSGLLVTYSFTSWSYEESTVQVEAKFHRIWPKQRLEKMFQTKPDNRVERLYIQTKYGNAGRSHKVNIGIKNSFQNRDGGVCREYVIQLQKTVRSRKKTLDQGVMCKINNEPWTMRPGVNRSKVEYKPEPQPKAKKKSNTKIVKKQKKAPKKTGPEPFNYINMFVELNKFKPNGKPWDIGWGKKVLPDLTVCIEAIDKSENFENSCYYQSSRSDHAYQLPWKGNSSNCAGIKTWEPAGACQNRNSCKFLAMYVPENGFNFAVIDVDLENHDLAGEGSCSPRNGCILETEGLKVELTRAEIPSGKLDACEIGAAEEALLIAQEELIEATREAQDSLFAVMDKLFKEKTVLRFSSCRDNEKIRLIELLITKAKIYNHVRDELTSWKSLAMVAVTGGAARGFGYGVSRVFSKAWKTNPNRIGRVAEKVKKGTDMLDSFLSHDPRNYTDDEIINRIEDMGENVLSRNMVIADCY